ncbi:hypothetical protein [Xenorhabdus griffiniae]|nr:hypothetical protein [Xenorhabdus griffiniae]MDC9605476.1 hypothetical protein [Xenorhabdus griffiniae]
MSIYDWNMAFYVPTFSIRIDFLYPRFDWLSIIDNLTFTKHR